jgi:hypothetical protein
MQKKQFMLDLRVLHAPGLVKVLKTCGLRTFSNLLLDLLLWNEPTDIGSYM